MPSKQTRKRSSDSTDSGDSEGEGELGPQRYRALQLSWALTTWEHNARATRELAALFEKAFARKAAKSVQNLMYEDLQLAMVQAERMGRPLEQLVAAALRVLPKQKRTAIASAHKRSGVQHARRGQRGAAGAGRGAGGDEADPEGVPLPSLADLPIEVVEATFQHLGPIELARCACVNRCWRDLARGADGIWRELHALTFQRLPPLARPLQYRAAPGAVSAAYSRFQQAAAGRPRPLRRWSGRVLGGAGPAWLGVCELRRMAPARLAALRFPREDQVVRWACREANDDSGGSEASGSSSASSSGDEGVVPRMRLWNLRK